MRYYGAYASRRRGWWRRRGVVLSGAGHEAASGTERESQPWPALRARRRRWAELLRMMFRVDVEVCPDPPQVGAPRWPDADPRVRDRALGGHAHPRALGAARGRCARGTVGGGGLGADRRGLRRIGGQAGPPASRARGVRGAAGGLSCEGTQGAGREPARGRAVRGRATRGRRRRDVGYEHGTWPSSAGRQGLTLGGSAKGNSYPLEGARRQAHEPSVRAPCMARIDCHQDQHPQAQKCGCSHPEGHLVGAPGATRGVGRGAGGPAGEKAVGGRSDDGVASELATPFA